MYIVLDTLVLLQSLLAEPGDAQRLMGCIFSKTPGTGLQILVSEDIVGEYTSALSYSPFGLGENITGPFLKKLEKYWTVISNPTSAKILHYPDKSISKFYTLAIHMHRKTSHKTDTLLVSESPEKYPRRSFVVTSQKALAYIESERFPSCPSH